MLVTIFLLIALVLFILASLPRVAVGGINLVPAGLAFVVAAMLAPLL
jgi:hypothetical protein